MRSPLLLLLLTAGTSTALAQSPLRVTSNAFAPNGSIPTRYTCEGADVSPPLSWSQVPQGTQSIAILMDDPDAPKGTVTHWILTNIPPETSALRAGTPPPEGAIATMNDIGNRGYAGPCPPSGRHRYRFQVFALDTRIPRPASRAELLSAIEGHVLAQGELVGTYQKQR